MSKKKGGDSIEEPKAEVLVPEVIIPYDLPPIPQEVEEEDTIVFTSGSAVFSAPQMPEVKPLGSLSDIKDIELVYVRKNNYDAVCTKSWAIAKGYEIIGKA